MRFVAAGALAALEPQRPGRKPRRVSELEQEVEQLRRQVVHLQTALEVATIRAEVAATLPRVGPSTEKKTTPPRSRRRKSGSPKS